MKAREIARMVAVRFFEETEEEPSDDLASSEAVNVAYEALQNESFGVGECVAEYAEDWLHGFLSGRESMMERS